MPRDVISKLKRSNVQLLDLFTRRPGAPLLLGFDLRLLCISLLLQRIEAMETQMQFQADALADSREQHARQHSELLKMMTDLHDTVIHTHALASAGGQGLRRWGLRRRLGKACGGRLHLGEVFTRHNSPAKRRTYR